MSQQIPHCKANIIKLLGLLASEEQQLAYEKNVPQIDITAELLCMWFDDQYHPDETSFTSCFTADELVALADFHQFYEARDEHLPQSQGTVRTWLANPVWQEIMRKADEALKRIAI